MSGNVDVPRHFIEQAFNELCPPTAGTLIRNRLIKQFLGIASVDEMQANAKKYPLHEMTRQSGRAAVVETASRMRTDVKQRARKLFKASLLQASGALEEVEDAVQEEHPLPSKDAYENDDENMEEDPCLAKDSYSAVDSMDVEEVEAEELEGKKFFAAFAPVPESVREDRSKHPKYWPQCLVVCLVLQACASRHDLLGSFNKVNTLPECFWDGWDIAGKGKNKGKYSRQKCKYQDNQRIQPSMLQSVFRDEGTPFIMLVRSCSHANLLTFVWNGIDVTATWYSNYNFPMHDQYKADIEKDLREAFRLRGLTGVLHINWESPQIPKQTNNWDCVIYMSVLADRLSRGVGYEDLDEPKVASYRPLIVAFLQSLGFNEEQRTLDDF